MPKATWPFIACAILVVATANGGCDFALDGFSGGTPSADSGTSRDATAEPEDIRDGGNPLEDGGATERDAATDAAAPAPCPTEDPKVIVCEDFETAPPSSHGWGDSIVHGLLAVEPSIGQRGSHALRARQDGEGQTDWGTSSGYARVLASDWTVGQSFTLTFFVQLVATSNEESVTFAAIRSGSGTYSVELMKSLDCPGGDACYSTGNYYVAGSVPYATAVRARLGEWHRAEVVFQRTTNGAKGSLSIDGKVIDQRDLDTGITGTGAADVRLEIGALYGKQTTEVIFDDIVVRREP